MAAQAQARRQLDCAVELDAFRLDPARGEVAPRDLRVLCCYPDMARLTAVLARDPVDRRGHGNVAVSDLKIERRVDLRIVEFHQHVVTGDAELSRAEGDKSRDIETPQADQIEIGLAGREAQPARRGVFEGRLGLD